MIRRVPFLLVAVVVAACAPSEPEGAIALGGGANASEQGAGAGRGVGVSGAGGSGANAGSGGMPGELGSLLVGESEDAGVEAGQGGEEPGSEDTVESTMTFFVASSGLGTGGDLGGLAGADAHCRRLAARAGAGARTWQAMLSTDTVDARSRIGEGPWVNRAGVVVASSVEQLFDRGIPFGAFRLSVMLDETGEAVPSASHDILTGTGDGGFRTFGGNCIGWTSNTNFDTAGIGHSDNSGDQGDIVDRGWVASHVTNCTEASITRDGGDGRFYCFALD